MKHLITTITLLLLSSFVLADFKKSFYKELLDDPKKKAELESYRKVFAGAEDIVIFEGLPHPSREEKTFNAELKRKDTIKLGQIDEMFYSPSVAAKNSDAIIEFLSTPGGLSVYMPQKCGFHSDYCIQFKNDGVRYQIFVCFSCSELLVLSRNKGTTFGFDVNKLRELLVLYHKKRPKTFATGS